VVDDFHGEILFCAFLSMVVMRKTKVKTEVSVFQAVPTIELLALAAQIPF